MKAKVEVEVDVHLVPAFGDEGRSHQDEPRDAPFLDQAAVRRVERSPAAG
jgi:hypothetical protein